MNTESKIILERLIGLIALDLGADFIIDHFQRQKFLDEARLNRPMLNISCGETNYGDINADIMPQNVSNFVQYVPNEKLPFDDNQFESVYCAHTLEHVDNPKQFLDELHRVGKKVFLIVPHFWGLWPILNPAHKWLIISANGYNFVENPFYNPDSPLIKINENNHWKSFSGLFIK
jgi:SAM-dependent methyltransferase